MTTSRSCASGGASSRGDPMAHLVIRKGPNAGQRLLLNKDTFILGRSPECDLPIPSPSISRQHARLLRVEDRWFIEDMLSRNGTYLNNQSVAARKALKKNDRIRICAFEAEFEEAPIPAAGRVDVAAALVGEEDDELESSSTLTT